MENNCKKKLTFFCPNNCTERSEFVKVTDCEVSIYCDTTRCSTSNVKTDQKNSEAIIVHNTNDVAVSPDDIINCLDLDKIKCPRCKKYLETTYKLLKQMNVIDKYALLGVCTHCVRRAQKERSCPECVSTVERYLDMRHEVKGKRSQVPNIVPCRKCKQMYIPCTISDKKDPLKSKASITSLLGNLENKTLEAWMPTTDKCFSETKICRCINNVCGHKKQVFDFYFPKCAQETIFYSELILNEDPSEEIQAICKKPSKRNYSEVTPIAKVEKPVTKKKQEKKEKVVTKKENENKDEVVPKKNNENKDEVIPEKKNKSIKKTKVQNKPDNKLEIQNIPESDEDIDEGNTTKIEANSDDSNSSHKVNTGLKKSYDNDKLIRERKVLKRRKPKYTYKNMDHEVRKRKSMDHKHNKRNIKNETDKVDVIKSYTKTHDIINNITFKPHDNVDEVNKENLLKSKVNKFNFSQPEIHDTPKLFHTYFQSESQRGLALDNIMSETESMDESITTPVLKDTPTTPSSTLATSPSKIRKQVKAPAASGVVQYALSDRKFIEKGWTKLPKEIVMHKTDVFRMRPAYREFDWYKNNKRKQSMSYDTGEKLAEFDKHGGCHWYYKNGRLALDYYDNEDNMDKIQRAVVYSDGTPDSRGRVYPNAILATFDYQGNGVVFDNSGKIRLKYDQNEGVILDKTIGPISTWKWHSLNDPPILMTVLKEKHYDDSTIREIGSQYEVRSKFSSDHEDSILAIEQSNHLKNSMPLKQFTSFEIQNKTIKINDKFSLRILNQETVILQYRDTKTNLKLHLGMQIDSTEIIATEKAEKNAVLSSAPLPVSPSVDMIRNKLKEARRLERAYLERENRIRPPVPVLSVDRMRSGVGRSVRPPPLRPTCPMSEVHRCYAVTSTTGTTTCPHSYRKPNSTLFYCKNDLV